MSAGRRTERRHRRGAPRLVGPAVIDLVAALARSADETVELRLSATLASMIARADAGDDASLGAPRSHAESAWSAATVTVDRATAERWEALAWRFVAEGLVTPAEAQALSDQLAPRGAA